MWRIQFVKIKALIGMSALLLGTGGCTRQAEAPPPAPSVPTTVKMVPANERSPAFARVSRELELGGTLYGYMDVNGDSQKIAGMMQAATRQMASTAPVIAAISQQDYRAIFTTLGFDDITAMGISSVPDAAGGFRNRAFFYTPNGRHGLLNALGGPPAPFTRTHMAPADADLYSESDVDLPAAYATIRDMVARIGGKPTANTLENQLKEVGIRAGFSLLDLIMDLKGRVVIIGRIDPGQTYAFPGKDGLVTPRLSLLIGIDGIGKAVQGALDKSPKLTRSESAGRVSYALKEPLEVKGLDLVASVDGSSLYLATSAAFLDACLARQSGLDQNPDFQRMLAALGTTGNSLSYVTPRLFQQIRKVVDLNPAAPRQTLGALAFTLQLMPVSNQPLMLIRQNIPDGILVRAHYHRSFKQELLMPAIYNPVTLGLAVATVALQKNQARQAPLTQVPSFPSMPAANVPFLGRTVEPDAAPTALSSPPPLFPPDLRRRAIEGVVVVDFIVDVQGRTRNARAVLTADPQFSSAAVEAVGRWRFKPGQRMARPVNSRSLAPVIFALDKVNLATPAESQAQAFYADLLKGWTDLAAKRSGRPGFQFRTFEPGALLWARIGLNADGGLSVEDVGHGPNDPGAAQLRPLIESAAASVKSTDPLAAYVGEAGHIDVGLPSISDLR